VGSTYNPWRYVTVYVSKSSNYLCAKARTAAQNIRSGSGCDRNTTVRHTIIDGGQPESAAYSYWSDGSDVRSLGNRAGT
jgi:hypothetical protein